MKKLTLVLLLSISASCYAVSDQVPMTRTITSIQAYDSFVFINFEPAFDFTQGCLNTNSTSVVAVDTSNALGKNIYSAALTAAATQKKVGFGVEGCHIDRPKAYRIDVQF